MTNNYANIFGGAVVPTSNVSYLALSISANISLVWPTESSEGANYVASQLDVSATVGGLSLAMPSAQLGSAGPATIVTNVGSNSFTLTNAAGAAIVTVASTVSYLISLVSNTTAAGSWRGYQLASTVSSATASGLADNLTIQANGSVLQTEQLTFSANAVLTSSKRGQLGLFTAGVNTAYSLPTAASCGSGWWCDLANQSAANTLTLNAQGGDTVNTLSSAVLNPGTSFRLLSTGSAFVLSASEFFSSNALMVGGGANATPAQIGTGISGQVLTSNGTNSAPSFQTITAAVVPVTANGCINGGCRISTRQDFLLGPLNLSTSPQYLAVDMVRQWVSGSGASVSNGVSNRAGGNTSTFAACWALNLTTAGAAATINWGIRIESIDAVLFKGQVCVFQAVIYQQTGALVNAVITINTPAFGADNWTSVTQLAQSANIPCNSGALTTLSLSTVMGGASYNGIEIIVSALIGAVTTQPFYLGDFGLFLGTSPISPFPNPLYAQEVQNCQRYLPRWPVSNIALTPYAGFGTSANTAKINLPYIVEPRTTPSGIAVNAAAAAYGVNDLTLGAHTLTSVPTYSAANASAVTIIATSTGNITNNAPVFFGSGNNSITAVFATGCEL